MTAYRFLRYHKVRKIKIYVGFFCLPVIGMIKIKARFEIFYFYFSQNFNFTCILGGKGTRSLWNDGQQIVWDHFIHLVNHEVNSGLKLISRVNT